MIMTRAKKRGLAALFLFYETDVYEAAASILTLRRNPNRPARAVPNNKAAAGIGIAAFLPGCSGTGIDFPWNGHQPMRQNSRHYRSRQAIAGC